MASHSPEQRKDHLLRELASARKALLAAARGLPVPKRRKVFLGIWSPRHLVSHLVGWDSTNLRACTEVLAGRLPSFYKHHDPDWAAYNKSFVAKYNRGSYERLVIAAERSHQRLLARLERIPAVDITRDRGIRFRGWRVTIERLLAAEAADERTHLEQLRRFARIP